HDWAPAMPEWSAQGVQIALLGNLDDAARSGLAEVDPGGKASKWKWLDTFCFGQMRFKRHIARVVDARVPGKVECLAAWRRVARDDHFGNCARGIGRKNADAGGIAGRSRCGGNDPRESDRAEIIDARSGVDALEGTSTSSGCHRHTWYDHGAQALVGRVIKI